MVIKVLGSGCANCQKLEARRRRSTSSGIDAEIVKVTDMADIMAYGVMSTPALVVDEQLRLAGRVPSLDEVVDLIARSTAGGLTGGVDGPVLPPPAALGLADLHRAGACPDSSIGAAVNFFLYDVPKVLILLAVVIFFVAIIRSFFPPERTRKYLSHSKLYARQRAAATARHRHAVLLVLGGTAVHRLRRERRAAGRDVLVPGGEPDDQRGRHRAAVAACSAGRSPRSTSSRAWCMAITSGIIIGKLGLESWVEEYVYEIRMGEAGELPEQTWPERLAYARGYVSEIVGKVWPYVVVGIGIGAVMHGYIPDDFLAKYAGAGNPLAVPLAVIIGVPLYSNAAGVVPLMGVLTQKGVAIGHRRWPS